MSRFGSKAELLEDARKARSKLEELLAVIPDADKLVEVTDGMTVKDFIAHRTEWGRMALRWVTESRAGTTPEVPAPGFKWNQLGALNAGILGRFAEAPLGEVESQFASVHDALLELMEGCTEEELLETGAYAFTGSSDLATYLSSATGGHYRSARKHIGKWWRARQS